MAIIGSETQTFVSPGSNSALGGGAGQRDLFLKKFSGETLATFNTKTVAKNYIRVRNVRGQKSAQFPSIGRATADYHQPGEVIDGQSIKHGEKVVLIDDLLVSPVFVSNFLEAMTHFETRSEYARQMGDALAQAYDKKVFGLALKACVDGTASTVPDTTATASKINIGATPSVSDFVTAVYQAQATLDKNDIPENDRVIFVDPDTYYDLIDDGRFLNRDFGNANGSQANATILQIAGLPIIKTNNLNLNHVNSVEREGSVVTDYDADARTVKALILQRQALGAVHLMDISSEAEYKIERQGTLMVSKMANGMDVLRPECLIAIDAVV